MVGCLPLLDDRVDNEKMFEGDSCTYTRKYLQVFRAVGLQTVYLAHLIGYIVQLHCLLLVSCPDHTHKGRGSDTQARFLGLVEVLKPCNCKCKDAN